MRFKRPVSDLIRRRFSCRTYLEAPIDAGRRKALADLLAAAHRGPLGTPARFVLVTATEQDRRALRGLGTYGFVQGATGFIIGAVKDAERNLEDYGCLMERIILFATDLDLGTCWLGGSFAKSSFGKRISPGQGETVPAVCAVGQAADRRRGMESSLREHLRADKRLPWTKLFFDRSFGQHLSREEAGPYAVPLEMVRLGPSASNRQPWRIVRDGATWHFYLQRTPGYRDAWISKLLRIADLQRVDMGIAMCHFELAAAELRLKGRWRRVEPKIETPDELTEYVVTWVD